MDRHDDDNIPVLVDIIHEHDADPAGEIQRDRKQKTLWDDDVDDVDETPAAAATPDTRDNAHTRDAADAALAGDASTGETADDTDFTDAQPAGESVTRLLDDEFGTAIDVVDEAACDEADAIEPDPAAAVYDVHVDAAPRYAQSPVDERIDIDSLAEQILRRLMPDLEAYLLVRIRGALHTALDGKRRD